MLNGIVQSNAMYDEKQIIIVFRIDVLSETDKRIIKKETINSVVVMPVVNLTNASRNVLIQIKINKQRSG